MMTIKDLTADSLPPHTTLGALFADSGALAGLVIVLDHRELAALIDGHLVQHAVPGRLDGGSLFPVVLCRPDAVTGACRVVEHICEQGQDAATVTH